MERPNPSSIPLTPGVYLYKDARGKIIYVGKARVLRRRVLSYFRSAGLPAKTVAMLSRAESIEYFTTTTEKEALLLEASLIKKHRPPYNIVLRDDKQYALFRINPKVPFPRLEIVRKVKKDGARYFGPFTSALAARETWKLLHRAFSLRHCSDRIMKNQVRPCIYHHMGQCPAPCMNMIKPEEYAKNVRKVCDLLDGRSAPLLDIMRGEMEKASEALDFERAAALRDQIRAVEKTVERQAAILPGAKDMDVVGLCQSDKGLAMGVIFVRSGAVGGNRSFFWPGLGLEDAPELMSSFLNQFYLQASPPPRILLPWKAAKLASFSENSDSTQCSESVEACDMQEGEEDDFEALEQIFSERRGGQVRIVAPQNSSDQRLVDLALASAKEEARRRRGLNMEEILEKIKNALHMKEAPLRIECVDVSHISGKQTRVGLVVYENGMPCREDYRLYSMPDSSDDYASLYAWVARRLESGPPWPDLLLIDGGRGQLASVAKALADAGQNELFALAAIAKARDEKGQADRRAGNVADRIFLPGRTNPLPIREGSAELLLLQQIRDATHHFAIQGHRKAHRAAALSGELMRLQGIGPATARLLWDKFGSLDAMRKADEEELMGIPGIGKARARMIIARLGEIS